MCILLKPLNPRLSVYRSCRILSSARILVSISGGWSTRGLKNYLYYFGGSLLQIYYNLPQNPIPIIKAPILGLDDRGFFQIDPDAVGFRDVRRGFAAVELQRPRTLNWSLVRPEP